MPANTLTVRLIIDVRAGRATRQLNRVDRSMRRVSVLGRILRRYVFRPLTSAILTMTKALLSMGIIMVAFTILVAGPIAAFFAMISVIRATIQTLAEFEQRILALQGILASTVIFLRDPVENFRNAGLVATSVVETLALRANEMVASLTEATLVFQTLLATGAQRSIRDVDQLVDLTILLSNSIAGITTGQDRQRQLAEETRSLFTQQLRANSLLTRILFRNRREMREFFRQAEAADNVVEQLTDRLSGFAAVAVELGKTLEGIQTTAQTILQVIARRAFGGILVDFEQRAAAFFVRIQEDIARLDTLAASLGAAATVGITALIAAIRRAFGITITETDNLIQIIIDGIPFITKLLVRIIFLAERAVKIIFGIGDFIGILVALFLDIYDLLRLIISTTIQGLSLIAEFISSLAGSLAQLLGLTAAFANLETGLGSLRDSIDSVTRFDNIRENVKQLRQLFAELFTGPDTAEQAAALFNSLFGPEFERNLDRILAARAAEEAATKNIQSLRRVDLETNIKITSELLKQSRALRSQVSSISDLVRLSLQGGLIGRGVSSLIAGGTTQLIENIENQISTLGKALRDNVIDLDLATDFGVIADTQQIEKLTQLIIQQRGEIAALSADLIALDAIFAQIGNITLRDLAQVFEQFVFGNVFRNLFDALLEGGDRMRSLFSGIIADMRAFVTSAAGQAALFAAIGQTIATGIRNAIQGTESFGQSLKRLLGDLLIALGEMLIVAGTVSVLFGLLTLNAVMIGQGLIAIAIGAGAIVAGIALGGGGGASSGAGGGGGAGQAAPSIREFAFSEAAINVQQATNDLVIATENLDRVTGTFAGVQPGQVVEKGLSEQGGATRVLMRDAQSGRNLSAAASTGSVLQGRT